MMFTHFFPSEKQWLARQERGEVEEEGKGKDARRLTMKEVKKYFLRAAFRLKSTFS